MKRVLALLLGLLLAAAAQPALAATSFTSCLLLPKPQVGDANWGNVMNSATTLTDSAVGGVLTLGVGGGADVTLTSVSGAADQARNAHFIFTGTLTANIQVFWPLNGCRVFSVKNATSGAFNLTIAVNNGAGAAAGTTVVIPQGSTAVLVSDGTNIVPRQTPMANGLAIDWGSHGQARLVFVSTTQLKLTPRNGNRLYVPGAGVMAVPAAGIILANNSTLTEGGTPVANTLYYVYAFNNGGALALQMSLTGHATDATTGIETRSGDASRVLVGMARMNASAQFADSAAQRFVASWFNRRSASLQGASFSRSNVVNGGAFAELSSASREEFLTWAEESVSLHLNATGANNTAGQFTQAGLAIDSATTNSTPGVPNGTSSTANAVVNLSSSFDIILAEGYHFATPIALVSGGTGTLTGSGLGLIRN